MKHAKEINDLMAVICDLAGEAGQRGLTMTYRPTEPPTLDRPMFGLELTVWKGSELFRYFCSFCFDDWTEPMEDRIRHEVEQGMEAVSKLFNEART